MAVEMIVQAIVLGIGATLVMDLWALARKRFFGVPALDYGLVGRWLGHMRHGQFHHAAIGKAPSVRGERAMGWAFHYVTGLAFAGAFLAVVGGEWLRRPTLWPALAFGALTVAAPLLLMQPAFGMGIAAVRTANPWQVRLRALLTHLVFGLGLYLTGWVLVLF
ncbi:DUF2938 domain-containing protein [Pseudomonas subflava]|uniref:DUF2938 domain-containing protein n=1 Tax=Pseudomonas subflava TaxID=2952933 RepID=UPI00207A11CC|nr:DUF2938 domain-containing protein [Pseudomonas subflava]